jgi:lipopolysaccharide/colanic/teichoic acid biosynthesis glycosyltransferase
MRSSLWHVRDWILAALLLGVAAPLMAGIAVLVWFDDGAPVLFKQRRAGKDGRPFSLIKFRTLSTEAEGTSHPARHTTRVGAVLRRWALDELPQLWNILRSDMNLVGPRPVLLAEARGYDDEAARRLEIRPGLTGWAQVHGRNRLSWAERMEHDLWYVRNRTLLLDLWILLRTPFVLLSGQGVYGPGTDDPSPSEVQSHLSSTDA